MSTGGDRVTGKGTTVCCVEDSIQDVGEITDDSIVSLDEPAPMEYQR